MAWVYLTISINGALYTVNALAPVKRNKLLFVPSFFASWITIELAWFHLIVQVLGTLVFARRGALRSGAGKLGLGISLASWIGLGYILRQSLNARHEIRRSLENLERGSGPAERHPVTVTRNVPYRRVAGRTLRLDVYRPAGDPQPGQKRPALVQVHGGGWTIGDKREQGLLVMRRMASHGWVGFNVNYRLSPSARFPEHLEDLKAALAWIREHADEYGVDPDFIAVTGGSAGGHLTALLALTANRPELQPGFEDADTSVQAAVPFYGVYDFTNRNGGWPPDTIRLFIGPMVMKALPDEDPERYRLASPLDQVHEGAPPFFVIHGTLDTLAPLVDAREFVHKLEAVSNEPVYYLELVGAQHAFEIFPSIRANQVIGAVARFLDGVHSAYVAAGGEEPSAEAVEEAVAAELDVDQLTEAPG